MKKVSLLLVFISVLFCQDTMKYDGKIFKGKYIKLTDKKIHWHFESKKIPSEIPLEYNRCEYIILKDGTKVDLGPAWGKDTLKYNGKVLIGRFLDYDLNKIYFQYLGAENPTEIPYDLKKIEFLKLENGEIFDFTVPFEIREQVDLDKNRKRRFSTSDIMVIGDEEVKKIKTHKYVGNDLWIYGKYEKIEYENAQIIFRGRDGKVWDDPTEVKSILNRNKKKLVTDEVIKILKNKRYEIMEEISDLKCKANSKIELSVMPFLNDYYGLTNDIEKYLDVQLCYSLADNKNTLKTMHNLELSIDELNDYHLQKIGKSNNLDFILHGYAYTYNVPFKFSSVDNPKDGSATRYKSDGQIDYFVNLLNSMTAWSIYNQELSRRNMSASIAGSYVAVTYFALNIETGEKIYLLKNSTVLKLN